MRRVVITGLGAVSCLGNSKEDITESLRLGRSGIVANEEFKEMGLRSQVSGSVNIDTKELIDRKVLRFMGNAAAYAYIAMQQAIDDSGLEENDVSNIRSGIIAASGGASSENIVKSADILRARGVRKVGPYMVTRTMGSSISACLATPFKIKGVNYSLTSACATSAHCIGVAAEQIQLGKQDIVFAGGGEEEHWTLACLFDAMGALSSKYNDDPATASRPYDSTRDGFVIGAGAGMVVVEELGHAKARGAKIYGELVGYGATVEGPIDYINTHGTSTPVGDVKEVEGMSKLFGEDMPRFGSSKSMCGHSLGATGAQEAIHCLLMMQGDFIAPSINVNELDPIVVGKPLVTNLIENAGLKTVMTNSFGFGGTNGTLVFQKC